MENKPEDSGPGPRATPFPEVSVRASLLPDSQLHPTVASCRGGSEGSVILADASSSLVPEPLPSQKLNSSVEEGER